MRGFWKRGEPMVLASGATLAVILLLTLTLVGVVLYNGLGFFWPKPLVRFELKDGSAVLGQIAGHDRHAMSGERRLQLKVGNRDLYSQDFRWLDEKEILKREYPRDAVLLERREHGNFFGFVKGLKTADGSQISGELWQALQRQHREALQQQAALQPLKERMFRLNRDAEELRLKILRLEYRAAAEAAIAPLRERKQRLTEEFDRLNEQLSARQATLAQATVLLVDAAGSEKELPLVEIVRAQQPNGMSPVAKAGVYLVKLKELLLDDPRESNTEGGLFPAIFGTVLMVLVMSFFSLPFGVVAAVYLREYAKDGWLVRAVRIAVNNLAGVPSIVYGVFGLGFFVYGIGGSIDALFYPERLPTPTFGTGGILWSSLTLALLTVPVVIVATEESLASIPKGVREGSLALGATRFQTLLRVLLPMATPGIMTGMVLSMARAAGEVAPLMMVGVVKLAPTLPFDSQFPFFHMDRKFMHLGFHIYDVGFQSPNVEAAKPMVYITTMLLLLIVIVATSLAIRFRNRMRQKYTTSHF